MSSLTIDLLTPKGVVLENTDIPQEYTVRQIVQELVDHLSLPYFDSERTISYSLKWVNQNLVLDPDQTLVHLGVGVGDQLQLLASSPISEGIDQKDTRIPDDPPPLPDRTIDVVLSVLDVNTTCQETYEVDLKIEDLIRIIGKKYKLPDFDNLRERTVYYIKSKALGRVLNGNETLRSARVPRHDRLDVLRTEIAG